MRLKIFFVLSVLFSLSLVSAVEFDVKENFSQGETLIAKVSGNFFEPIAKEDIIFLRNHVRISIIPFVKEIDNDFYIYAQLLNRQANNYSIVIENAKYYQGNQIIEEDLTKNFTITENLSDFLIDPGFILTDKDFFIEVQNLRNSQITINYRILNESETKGGGFFESLFGGGSGQGSQVNVKSDELKKINFEIDNFTFSKIQIIELTTENTKYEIPVYISLEETKEEKTIFKFEPSELNISMPTNSKTTRIIYLSNTGNEILEDIDLLVSDSLEPYLSVSIENISELDEDSRTKIELSFSSPLEEKLIEGQIRARTSDEIYAYLQISLNFLEDYEPLPGDSDDVTIQICSELSGIICEENKECSGDVEIAKDGICCLATCEEIKKTSTGVIIGWLLFLVVIIFLIWFYLKRYRGVRNVVDLLQIARGRR